MTLTMDVPYVEVNGERIYATLKDEVLSSAGLTKTGIWETTNNGSRFSCVLTDVYVKNLGPNVVEPVPTLSTGETRSILVSNDASRAIGNIHEVSLTSPNLQAGSHCILTAKVDPASSYPSSPQKGNGAPASKTAAESETPDGV